MASTIGRLTYTNSASEYIGEIEDLKKHGCGIFKDAATGRRYEGVFEDDFAMGEGTLYFPNGDVYTGNVDKMIRHGPGIMKYHDSKRVFEGMFEKDLKEGIGFYFQEDGKVYCGQFRTDKEEGVGEYLDSNQIETHFKRVDTTKVEMTKDKLFKISRQLNRLGV